mmetsp:Transcript_129724/g.276796  ORF Transcript_129724/g.276796 Transcript_129724/m.276796 type:complete len:239 (-) Transcript_129724:2069-2785(-)
MVALRRSHDLEHLLHSYDQLPIILVHLILEMLLESINALPGNVRIQLVAVVEMTPVGNMRLLRILLNLHADRIATACDLQLLVVPLNARHTPDLDVLFLRHAQRRAYAKLATHDSATEDHRVCLVEDAILVDLQHHWEDSLYLRIALLRLVDLVHVSLELVEEVVDDIGGHDLYAVGFCLLNGFGADLHVEAKNHGVLRHFLFLHDHGLLHVLLVHLSDAYIKHWDLHILQEGQERLQ